MLRNKWFWEARFVSLLLISELHIYFLLWMVKSIYPIASCKVNLMRFLGW